MASQQASYSALNGSQNPTKPTVTFVFRLTQKAYGRWVSFVNPTFEAGDSIAINELLIWLNQLRLNYTVTTLSKYLYVIK
jgi:hypothetical protein